MEKKQLYTDRFTERHITKLQDRPTDSLSDGLDTLTDRQIEDYRVTDRHKVKTKN